MKQGKLSNAKLSEVVFSKIVPQNADTVVGAGVGEDCCAVRLQDGLCVVSTDPITGATENCGSLAVHINANDIAAAGAQPIAALVTLLIPVDAQESQIAATMNELAQTAQSMGIDIIGGHTEITEAVRRIVVSVTMIGKPVAQGKMFRSVDMRAGDDIIMTKYAGLEGTAILASDHAAQLSGILTLDDMQQVAEAKASLSVVPEGLIAARIDGVSAMHDITEGGVIGALHEMCDAAGVGALVNLSRVPVLPVTERICAYYGLDVMGLISSGSMIICAADGAAVCDALANSGIMATIIGHVEGERVRDAKTGQIITPYDADELYKASGDP